MGLKNDKSRFWAKISLISFFLNFGTQEGSPNRPPIGALFPHGENRRHGFFQLILSRLVGKLGQNGIQCFASFTMSYGAWPLAKFMLSTSHGIVGTCCSSKILFTRVGSAFVKTHEQRCRRRHQNVSNSHTCQQHMRTTTKSSTRSMPSVTQHMCDDDEIFRTDESHILHDIQYWIPISNSNIGSQCWIPILNPNIGFHCC